jgi:transposase
MRKMQEYIVKGNKIFIGLEDSKKTWKLCVRCDGMIVHETSMPAKYEVLQAYLNNKHPECCITVMYEAGFQGFWLHDLLEADGIRCIVTPPNKVTMPKDNRVKTDKRDAKRLAQNLENGDYVSCEVPDRERREDRQIIRTLSQIQKDIKRVKNWVRRCLDFHGLNEGLKVGTWTDNDYRKIRDIGITGPVDFCLELYLSLLDKLHEAEKALKDQLRSLCEKKRYADSAVLKQTVPGVGWLTAIRLTLEWGDMQRFPSGKHIASYTGLTSSEYSSGEKVHRGRITGQGNSAVRGWLIECAWRSMKKDPVLLHKFRAVWKNSGSKKKAAVAVARKLAVRMWAIEVHQTPYCIGVAE